MDEFTTIFPRGEENTAFAQYFIGKSYLARLSSEQVGIANVTFEPAAATTGTSTTRPRAAARSCCASAAAAGIRSGASPPVLSRQATWSTSPSV